MFTKVQKESQIQQEIKRIQDLTTDLCDLRMISDDNFDKINDVLFNMVEDLREEMSRLV